MNALFEQVMVAVEVFQECLEADDLETIQRLVARGIDQSVAMKVIWLVPLAFCRYMLKDSGVRFSKYYRLLVSESSKSLELQLAEEPVYEAALIAAKQVFTSDLGQQYYYSVAGRSAEFKAINAALSSGSKFENLECSPPVIEQ